MDPRLFVHSDSLSLASPSVPKLAAQAIRALVGFASCHFCSFDINSRWVKEADVHLPQIREDTGRELDIGWGVQGVFWVND